MEMTKNIYLLPNKMKKWGWWIFGVMLIIGLVGYYGYDGSWFSTFIKCDKNSIFTISVVEAIYNDVLIIGILGGAVMITCSKEKLEDELTGKVRLNSLLLALYANTIIIVIATLTTYDLLYLNVMLWNLFTLPILFLIIYELSLWKLNKTVNDEEQNKGGTSGE